MRVLGIDFGSRRHGLAVSDGLGLTAQPLGTLERQNETADMKRFGELVDEHEIGRIVIGLPLNMDGSESVHFKDVEIFAAQLGKHTELPIEMWEERLTTSEAERILLAADTSRKKRKKVIDKLAAALILQSWMDANQATLAEMKGAV